MSRLRRTLVRHQGQNPMADASNWPIETFESGYRLAESTWVDVRAFHDQVSKIRRLRAEDPAAAMRLLLSEELPDPDTLLAEEPYVDWALTARERVFEEVRLLEQMKVELLVSHGRPAEALDALQGILRFDASNEECGRQAMEIAWELGNRQTAINIYERLRRALYEEVGVEPSADTIALYRRIYDARTQPTAMAESAATASPFGNEAGFPVQSLGNGLRGQHPVYLTRFVGRERELLEICDSLSAARLLTLHGPGGTGKTRLALEAVKRAQGAFVDGVCWIDLSAMQQGRLLPHTIASALAIRERPNHTLMESICEALRHRSILLVLDNCEHVLDDVRAVVDTLLRSCPGLRIIGTSQATLGVHGETVYSVSPLSVPIEGATLGARDLARYDSVTLFIDRAAAVRHGFRLTEENAAYIARICRRLHGNPLAIELAASKLGTLTPSQIASRLDQRFHLLKSGHNAGPKRHRSLLAVLDWAYDLLPDFERKVWERMSVFVGDFSLETIESVLQDAPEGAPKHIIVDAVARLVERSILVAEESGAVMRYRFLESMREYGLLKLGLSGKEREAKQTHLRWCLKMVEQAAAAYCTHKEMEWVRRLDAAYDEVRTALAWAIDQGEREACLRLAGSLWWFWMSNGRVDEGRSFTTMVLEMAGESEDALYAMALHTMAPLSMWLGEGEVAKRYLFKSLQILERVGDSSQLALVYLGLGMALLAEGDRGGAERALHTSLALARGFKDECHMATALWHLGSISFDKGDMATATDRYHKSLALCRRLGYERGEVVCLGGLGMIAYTQGHEALGVQTLEEGLALSRRLGDHVFGSLLLDYLGWIARRRKEYDRALELHQESLRWKWTVRDRTGAANTLGHLAETALCLGQLETAALLFGAQQGWQASDGAGLPWARAATLDRTEALARLEAALPASEREAASLRGRLMRPHEVVAYALDIEPAATGQEPSTDK